MINIITGRRLACTMRNCAAQCAQGGSETRFAAMCALSWSNFATSCSRPMKLLHYVSQAPHTNICNSIMHKDLQNAAISLNESNSWRRLITKEHTWLQTWFQTPLCHIAMCLRVLRDALHRAGGLKLQVCSHVCSFVVKLRHKLPSFNEIAAFCKSLCIIELHIFVCGAWLT